MTYERNCPDCGAIITYSAECYYRRALRLNTHCRSCGNLGNRNGFFGRTHTAESKKNMGKKEPRSEKEKTRLRLLLTAYGNTKHPYEIWLEKYGKEEADKRLSALKKKHSANNSGKGNPMYGKPPPNGSGNGWSGWYKEWYFRSLRELSYMMNVIEPNQYTWESGELKKYKIQYEDWQGCKRNYFPDFIINGTTMVECKPMKLHNSPKVLAKRIAAEKFCSEHGYTYVLVDPPILTDSELKELYVAGKITFLPKYDAMFQARHFLDSLTSTPK